ncbi:hypothetical protein ACIHAX_30460, partial [Nocardia sp. NPDC051929]|uniref:hypothetical protein n=1 Tax=Nocardia sp. NPDC051929 TaxID=3364327 RepID=UPI0037C9EFC2
GQVPEFVDPNTAAPPTNGGTGSGGGTGNNNGNNGDNGNNSGGDNNNGKSNANGSGGTGGGSGSEAGGSGNGSGAGSGSGNGGPSGNGGTSGAPSGDPGQGTGPSGAPGTGASGALSASEMLSMFSEVLQLITSGITTLAQLGNQLAAQLGPGLQALTKAVEDGTLTVKQALAEAAERIGEDIAEVEELLLPPGATGPVDSRALLPSPNEALELLQLGVPGRAAGNQPAVFQDFTTARSIDDVVGEPGSAGVPGIAAEGGN